MLSNHSYCKTTSKTRAWSAICHWALRLSTRWIIIESFHLVDRLTGLFAAALKKLFFITWLMFYVNYGSRKDIQGKSSILRLFDRGLFMWPIPGMWLTSFVLFITRESTYCQKFIQVRRKVCLTSLLVSFVPLSLYFVYLLGLGSRILLRILEKDGFAFRLLNLLFALNPLSAVRRKNYFNVLWQQQIRGTLVLGREGTFLPVFLVTMFCHCFSEQLFTNLSNNGMSWVRHKSVFWISMCITNTWISVWLMLSKPGFDLSNNYVEEGDILTHKLCYCLIHKLGFFYSF